MLLLFFVNRNFYPGVCFIKSNRIHQTHYIFLTVVWYNSGGLQCVQYILFTGVYIVKVPSSASFSTHKNSMYTGVFALPIRCFRISEPYLSVNPLLKCRRLIFVVPAYVDIIIKARQPAAYRKFYHQYSPNMLSYNFFSISS